MAYVSAELLRIALDDLNRAYSPLLLISVPCMREQNVPVCRTAAEAGKKATAFGAPQEREWLDKYFAVRGGPPGKPYYMPGTREWVQHRYPDRSLQRRRKDYTGKVFFHPTSKTWAFRPEAGEVLRDEVLKDAPPVPLVALMAWMLRDQDIGDSLETAVANFASRLNLGDALASVYDASVPKEYDDAGLSAIPIDPEILADLVGATPSPAEGPRVDDLRRRIEEHLERQNFIAPPGLVTRVLAAWASQQLVVLVGPTGSGKTFFSRVLISALESEYGDVGFTHAFFEIPPDLDSAQFLGYQNLAGDFTPGPFADKVLFEGDQTSPRLVVLDEWNLAQIDNYFAPILGALESSDGSHLPGVYRPSDEPDRAETIRRAQPSLSERKWFLPTDTFFLATCNSWLDEPQSRLPISGPVKRRSTIIHMPNSLALAYDSTGDTAIAEFVDKILSQQREAVAQRAKLGRESQLDRHRQERLAAIATSAALPTDLREALWGLASGLLDEPEAQNVLTPGILRDVLLACVYSEPRDAMAMLGHQVTDKLLHQIGSSRTALSEIVRLTTALPNHAEIAALAQRMGRGTQHIRPLL